jgi:hypothetical protein
VGASKERHELRDSKDLGKIRPGTEISSVVNKVV